LCCARGSANGIVMLERFLPTILRAITSGRVGSVTRVDAELIADFARVPSRVFGDGRAFRSTGSARRRLGRADDRTRHAPPVKEVRRPR